MRNINDRNMGNQKYVINISGNNVVNGVIYRWNNLLSLFGYGGKSENNARQNYCKLRLTLPFGGRAKWLMPRHTTTAV